MDPKLALLLAVVVAAFFWAVPYENIIEFISGNNFEIRVSDYYEQEIHYETITIKNISFHDLKNVVFTINSGDIVTKTSDSCDVGQVNIVNGYSSGEIEIKFESMSSKYECIIIIQSSIDDEIYRGTAIGDNVPKYEWSKFGQNTEYLSYMPFLVLIIAGIMATWIYFTSRDSEKISLIDSTISIDIPSLRKNFGVGFIDNDQLVLEAIKKENFTVEEISGFTNLSKRTVKKRLKFLRIKKIIF